MARAPIGQRIRKRRQELAQSQKALAAEIGISASYLILSLMTTVRSYAAILKDYGDLTEDERRRFMTTLSDESERLAVRGADLFDFIGGRGRRPAPSPQEEVEDFISDRANYFPRL